MIAHIEHGYSLREIVTHLGCSVTNPSTDASVPVATGNGARPCWPRVERRRPGSPGSNEPLRSLAAEDSDFDPIRDETAFKELVQGNAAEPTTGSSLARLTRAQPDSPAPSPRVQRDGDLVTMDGCAARAFLVGWCMKCPRTSVTRC